MDVGVWLQDITNEIQMACSMYVVQATIPVCFMFFFFLLRQRWEIIYKKNKIKSGGTQTITTMII